MRPLTDWYAAAVPAKELGPGWREVVLPLSQFLDKDKRPPARWQDLDKLGIRARAARREPPQFARFRWVDRRTEGPVKQSPSLGASPE